MITSQDWHDADQDPKILKKVRTALIGGLIAEIMGHQESLGDWEKMHFAHAIASFRLNLNGLHKNSAWLRLCAVNVEKAISPKVDRNEAYVPIDAAYSAITFEDLMAEAFDIQKIVAGS